MKRFRFGRLLPVLLPALLATALFAAKTAPAAPVAPAAPAVTEVKPEPVYAEIARRLTASLGENHLSGERFDDRLSQAAWTNFINLIDFDHTLLTQEDLDAVAGMKTAIDDMMRAGDLTFGYRMMDLVRRRITERYDFIDRVLQDPEPFDFTKDETYLWKREDAPHPADAEAQRALWRAALKNEYLAIVLNRELDAEEAAKKPEQEPSEEAASDASAEQETREIYVEEENPDEPVADVLRRRYRQLRDVYAEMDAETVLQRYLSAVATAYDPHTDYMSPMSFEEFAMDMNLTLYGIGATLRYDDGYIRVMEVMPGGPAGRDTRDIRLRAGDRIVGVAQEGGEMEDVVHKPLQRTIRKIRGPKGTKVILKVIPFSDKTGSRTKIVDLVRDEIRLEDQAVTGHIETVKAADGTERRIGYARVPAFYAGTAADAGRGGEKPASVTRDLLAILQDFNAKHVDGLVLDLRGNGGGSLLEALAMNGLFVSGPVVQVKDARSVQVLPCQAPVVFRKPMVVLTNRLSASASEIVAGALQDYGRAIVIGDSKTHGKGTVQTVQGFGDSKTYGAYRVTTACFYRITGATTQVRGVVPDLVIPSAFDAMDRLGEDKLPGALPYSEIEPAFYARTDETVAGFIPRLKAASDARLAKDEQYGKTARMIDYIRKANAEKTVPLRMDLRRERMRAERALEEWEEKELSPVRRLKDEGPTAENDPVLRESLSVLSDFIDLRGGPDQPVRTDGDVGSRLFNIFGNGASR